MPRAKDKNVSRPRFSRRTLIEWMGTGTVLSLTTTIKGCWLEGSSKGGTTVRNTSSGDFSFPFEPGKADNSVFDGWGERTVDQQELQAILRNWNLIVDGLVQNPLQLSFGQLTALSRQDQVTDFHCVEGWSVLDVPWNGVHLSKLFSAARVKSDATHVMFHTIDERYNESIPLAQAQEPKTLLAYGIAGSTLPLRHGFPLRLVVPRLLAYKNPKYVQRIELTDRPVNGFWVQRGYSYEGEVPPSRLRAGKY